MAVPESVQVRTSLRQVLHEAGVGFEADQASMRLDLSVLDGKRWAPEREQALLMTASLLFRLGDEITVSAKLPETLRSRRALAASGVMFALADHHATFDDESPARDRDANALFDAGPLRRFSNIDSWRDTYTPFDSELRDLMIPSAIGLQTGTSKAWAHRPTRGIGIYDDDFAAFVNPHRLPAGKELQAIASVASPWFARLMAADRSDAEHVAGRSMEFLGHALDNVREHAFHDQAKARSLVTLGRVTMNETPMYRLQILDNGIGIPASLSEQLGESALDVEGSKTLLDRVVHGTGNGVEPLLPMGRNLGIPSMRDLAGTLSGQFWIVTCGPNGSQITVTCDGDQANAAYADLVPVTGTVVTLMVPFQMASASAETQNPTQETLDL